MHGASGNNASFERGFFVGKSLPEINSDFNIFLKGFGTVFVRASSSFGV